MHDFISRSAARRLYTSHQPDIHFRGNGARDGGNIFIPEHGEHRIGFMKAAHAIETFRQDRCRARIMRHIEDRDRTSR